ncbi:MAG: flavodoxin family protein [Oscillospiraceae bacterium]
MKVILINGSPNKNGVTYTSLCEMAKVFEKNGIETKMVQAGGSARGCIGCKACVKTGVCAFGDDDFVNSTGTLVANADGVVVGSPVHYAAASGAITGFMDRLFYSHGKTFANKPAAAVVSCRRGGASAAFDQLNKYFSISSMPIVTSQYWNQLHGNTVEDALQDLEGLQTMRTLAENMSWLLKCINAGKENNVPMPQREAPVRTSFIR